MKYKYVIGISKILNQVHQLPNHDLCDKLCDPSGDSY